MTQDENPRQEKRFEKDAEAILEQDMFRQRWSAKDRDAIAARLRRIVAREAQKERL